MIQLRNEKGQFISDKDRRIAILELRYMFLEQFGLKKLRGFE